jgi:hypothetical protein
MGNLCCRKRAKEDLVTIMFAFDVAKPGDCLRALIEAGLIDTPGLCKGCWQRPNLELRFCATSHFKCGLYLECPNRNCRRR